MEGNYVYKYPRPAVTTDCVIFGYDTKEGLSVLLVKRGIEPYKDYWAFPGGDSLRWTKMLKLGQDEN